MKERTTSEGINESPWYTTQNHYWKTGYGMPNCTAYAHGRVQEICGHEIPYEQGNAISFSYKSFAKKVDQPTFGAFAVWGGTYYGHVAVVEHVYEDGTILISESNYGGSFFNTAILSPSNNYNNSGLPLVGFYLYDGVTKAIEKEQSKIKEECKAKVREFLKVLEQEKVDLGYSLKPETNFLGAPDSIALMGTISIQLTKNVIKNKKIFDMLQKIWYIMSVTSWERMFA